MNSLKDLNYVKVNTKIIDQYTYKNGSSIVIEHIYTKDNPQGTWKYYGNSIWDPVPTFNSIQDLLEYLQNK